LGSCSATGTCFSKPTGPQCGAIELVCGCGSNQASGCGFPEGYASGPALSGTDCIDAGPPKPEAGTNLGPCGTGRACAAGASCYFPIGSCAAKGACIVDPAGPTCKLIESFCGCGEMVTTGCGYPDGYASGPTTGASICSDAGGD
jgi:hypothetical protein